jgi:hypothetical protein
MGNNEPGGREFQVAISDLIKDFPGEIQFRTTNGADLLHDDGRVLSREIFSTDIATEPSTTGSSNKTCKQSFLIDVGGLSETDANGKVTLHLSDYTCRSGGRDHGRYFGQPTVFVATPRSSSPVFITSRQRTIETQVEFEANDIEIDAYSWDAEGKPAPSVPFSWRCLVAVDFVVT